MTATATVSAHAKLTRTLRVTGVRHDGYHLIDAEMVTLALADVLEITPHDEDRPPRIEVIGPHAGAVGADGDNLVARALVLCGRRADVRLRKEIPAGGTLEVPVRMKVSSTGRKSANVKVLVENQDAPITFEMKAEVAYAIRALVPDAKGNPQPYVDAAEDPSRLKGLGLFHSTAYADSVEKKQARDKTIDFIERYGTEEFVEEFVPPLFFEGRRKDFKDEIKIY